MMDKEVDWSKSKSFYDSCLNAVRGLKLTYQREANFRRQIAMAILAVVIAVILDVPLFHLAIIVLMSTIVLVLEIINTSFEALADATYPEYNEIVRSSKDIFAGAVLLASVMAGLVGLLIFVPPVVKLFT